MDQKSFFLTVVQATGLPIKDGKPPSTCVRCKIQSTQAIIFCTPIRPETAEPIFDHKEVVAARYRLLIFEVIDDTNAVLGGFKIDAQIICDGLMKCREHRMKIDYPLGQDRSSLLTLSFQLIVNPAGGAPGANPGMPRSASDVNSPMLNRASSSSALRGPTPIQRSTTGDASSPEQHHQVPPSADGRGLERAHTVSAAERPAFDPFLLRGSTGAPRTSIDASTVDNSLTRSGSGSISGDSSSFIRGPGPARVKQTFSAHPTNPLTGSGTIPNFGASPPGPSILPSPTPPSPQSAFMPPQEVAKLQEQYKMALKQIDQLQTELRQTQEALAQAQAALAQYTGAYENGTPIQADRRTSDAPPPVATPTHVAPTQPAVPETPCEICSVGIPQTNRVILFNHIFCRKCALEARQNLGKNIHSPEAFNKYFSQRAATPTLELPEGELSTSASPPEGETIKNDLASSPTSLPGTPNPNPNPPGGNFRLFSIDNTLATPPPPAIPMRTASPSTAGMMKSASQASFNTVLNPGVTIPKVSGITAIGPPINTPAPPSPHSRDSKEYFVSEGSLHVSDTSEGDEENNEQLVDFYLPEDASNIQYSEVDGELKAATFTMLIAKLTQMPSIVDIDDFLLTYRSFTTPGQLVSALITRFEQVRPDDARIINLRIFNIFGRWISNFWFDFSTDVTCAATTSTFLDKIIADTSPNNSNNVVVAKTIKQKLEKKQNTPPGGGRKIFTDEMPSPIFEKDPTAGLINADPIEIARQITLRTWDTWVAIKPWEFLGLAWTKHGREQKAYNVMKMTQQFNNFSSWVSSTILTGQRPQDRVKLVKKFLDIGSHLRAMGNFNGVMEIWSGLQRQPVFRMNKTQQEVLSERRYHQLWTEFAELNDRDRNFGNLRAAIQSTNPPVIPYLGMYQSDLVFIEEGNPKKLGELINYFKCRSISATIKKIQQYQQKPPAFQKVPSIAIKLENLPIIESEEDMYAISLFYEPREGREPGPRPPALDAYLQKAQAALKNNSPGGVSRKAKASFAAPGKRRSDPTITQPMGSPPLSGVVRTGSISMPSAPKTVVHPKRSSRPPTDDERDFAEQLCAAAWNGNLETVKNLLSLPNVQHFINIQNSRGQPALYCAARQGHVDIVVELLNTDGIDIASTNVEHGSTALHAASFADQPEVVTLLLFSGADAIKHLNKNGLNARSEARGTTLDVYAHFDHICSVSNGEDTFDSPAMSSLQALKTAYPSTNLLKKCSLDKSI